VISDERSCRRPNSRLTGAMCATVQRVHFSGWPLQYLF
jgi:hypothetical protein